MSDFADKALIDETGAASLLKGIRIPPQPQILADIHMEIAMPGYSFEDIAVLIAKDVGLSGYVLKAVNSAFFGLRQPVTSIQQALSLLGVQSVINIVNAASLRNTLSNEAISALTLFWDNAMDIAAASALIARKLGICSPDEAYALGLFHNCGIPLLLEKFSDYLLTIMEAYSVIDGRITDIEDAQINTNHAVIGYFVARSWKLPMPICEVILDHHRTEEVFGYKEMEQTEKKNMLAVLKLAAHLCGTHKVLGKVELDYEFSRLSDILMSYLGLSSIDLVDLKDDLVELGL